jgi:hypothetical protein
MNPAIVEFVSPLVRQFAILVGGYLLQQGLITEGDMEKTVAGIVALVFAVGGMIWSVYGKRQEKLAALAAPAGTTERELKAIVKDPEISTPPVFKSTNPALTARPYLAGTGDGVARLDTILAGIETAGTSEPPQPPQ